MISTIIASILLLVVLGFFTLLIICAGNGRSMSEQLKVMKYRIYIKWHKIDKDTLFYDQRFNLYRIKVRNIDFEDGTIELTELVSLEFSIYRIYMDNAPEYAEIHSKAIYIKEFYKSHKKDSWLRFVKTVNQC